jgi:class 3 adenylate cyclase/tetratricopeptide (TPR) repeat protein
MSPVVGSTVSTGAILFTDMVDSTALRSRLGDDRADLLRTHHDALLAGIVEAHGGAVTRFTGDGIKAAFGSASDAVGAAVAIQRAVIEYCTSTDAIAVFQIRVGLAVGEVTIDENGDRRGVAVVEAARLEALARPGEILATEMVRMLGQRRTNVMFDEVGERTLKGLDDPVVVYRVIDLEQGAAPPMPRLLVADQRLPIVGREQQMSAFVSQWSNAKAGVAGLLLVRGPAGMGKTRFVSHCAEIAHEGGAIVLGGMCSSDLEVPYEPLAMAFRAATGLDEALDSAVASRSGSLARLFPGSTSGDGDQQPALARLELFDAVAALVRRLSRSHPLMLVVEDLHWATAPTVLLLRHLIEEHSDQRLLIVGTYREGDVDGSHPLRELLSGVRANERTRLTELARFNEADVLQLVSSLAPAAPVARVAAVAATVHRESAGNPFFASELLHHLTATGQLERALADGGDHRLPVPESVHDVLQQRLARLPSGTQELLTHAAVIGPTFDVGLVGAVAGMSTDDALDVLESVARSGIVVEVGVDEFAFVHAIVRNALLDELSASRLARAHRRVAEALEARGADHFDELARHWQLAGMESNSTKYLAMAARRDMVALAYESAKARYQQVIDQLHRDPSADVAERARAWLGFAAAVRALGDPAFRQAVVHAGRLARTARSPELIAEAASLSYWLSFFVAELPDVELIELCEDAISMLADTDPMRVRLLAALASHLTFSPNREQREQLIEEANRLAAQNRDPLLSARVLHAEFMCLWEPGTLERREQVARDLGRLARATGDPHTEFLAGYFTAYCLAERGDLPASVARLRELGPATAATRSKYYSFLLERMLLTISIFRSEPGGQARIDELFQRFGPTQVDAEPSWMIQTAVHSYQAGTMGQLVNSLQAMTAGPQARMWAAGLAVALLWAGDTEGAEEVLDQPDDIPRNYFWLPVMQARAEVAAGLGRRDHCRRIFDELLPHRGGVGITGSGSSCFALVSRSLGLLALTLDELPLAVELLTEAVEQADRVGAVFDGVTSRRLLATALRRAGDHDASEPLLAAASATAAERGFQREAELLRALVADHTA